ncbi:MAG: hypothetical protein ACPG49_04185 [Chitinophagales bacterium]
MAMFKKLKRLTAAMILTKKESSFVKGGLWVDREEGKSHGCPPPFDEQ